MLRVLFAVPVCFLTAMAVGAQDQLPQAKLWEHTFSGGAMRHYEVTALGTLLVSLTDSTVVLDPGTGERVWSSHRLRDCWTHSAGSPPFPGTGRAGDPQIRWRWGDEKDMVFRTFDDLPIIVAWNDKNLVVLDIGDGSVIWDFSDLESPFRKDVGWWVSTSTARLRVWGKVHDDNRTVMFAIDLQSQEVSWENRAPPTEGLDVCW